MKNTTFDRRPISEYNSIMKIPVFVLGMLILLVGASLSEETAFTLLGVEIPAIENKNWILETDTVLYTMYPMTFDLQFFVSDKGTVDSFKTIQADFPDYINKISNSLGNILFYPARYEGRAIPFVIPARLIFYSRKFGMQVDIQLPYEEPECSKRKFQLEEMLELNGFSIPGIVSYPSYFISVEKSGEKFEYPFSVAEVEIDSAGQLVDFEILYSYGRDFSNIIGTSLLYADFEPAEYKGVGFNSRIFIIYRFFGSIQYPTGSWPPEPVPGINLPFEYLRIEPLLYLDSIVNPPIPLNFPAGLFKYDSIIPFSDSAEVSVNIDENGRVRSFRILSFVNNEIERLVNEIIKKLRFLPARDLSSNRTEFNGTLSLEFSEGKFVYIWTDWLPLSAQSPPTVR